MLRFYTPADSKKSLSQLYRIESVRDYVSTISSLKIDARKLKEASSVHEDYAFAEQYICSHIETAQRIVFLGVFDLSKEAYFINKYPDKRFLIGDVSIAAIKDVPKEFKNVDIIQATYDDFKPEANDLVISNISEYFLTQRQLNDFISSFGDGRGGLILVNVHSYMPSIKNKIFWGIREIRAFIVNLLSVITQQRQWQFRGWWRTTQDFSFVSKSTDKCLKAIIFNKNREGGAPGLYAAMIHYESRN